MYQKAWQTMVDSEHILLILDINPDGDALGCMLALYDALRRLNKKVSLYSATKNLQKVYDFLPSIDKIRDKLPVKFDVVVSFDYESFDRAKIDKDSCTLINIDHQKSSKKIGAINLAYKEHSIAGLVVYDLLDKNCAKISKNCATCLYVAIVWSTEFFTCGKLDTLTFDIVSKLVRLGANPTYIASSLKSRQSLAKVRLQGYVLNNFELHFDAQIASIYISKEVLAKTGASSIDAKDVIYMLQDIAPVKVAIMILEEVGSWFKVLMRSKDSMDVSVIATKFGGSGDKNSAWFESKSCSFLELKAMIIKRIMEYEK